MGVVCSEESCVMMFLAKSTNPSEEEEVESIFAVLFIFYVGNVLFRVNDCLTSGIAAHGSFHV